MNDADTIELMEHRIRELEEMLDEADKQNKLLLRRVSKLQDKLDATLNQKVK